MFENHSNFQKQPSRGVLCKRCFENMQQTYNRTSMLKWAFNKVALQLYWNHTSAWLFSFKFAAHFQNPFLLEHLWRAAFIDWCVFEVRVTILNPFRANVFFLYPLYTFGFLMFLVRIDGTCRGSRPEVFCKNGVLRNFCRSHMSEACNFIKKETLAQVFSCKFFEISKNISFTEHL